MGKKIIVTYDVDDFEFENGMTLKEGVDYLNEHNLPIDQGIGFTIDFGDYDYQGLYRKFKYKREKVLDEDLFYALYEYILKIA